MNKKQREKRKFIIAQLCMCFIIAFTLTILMLAALLSGLEDWHRLLLVGVSIVFLIPGIIICCFLDVSVGFYECPHCKSRFVPTVKQYVLGVHTITRRKLTCPNCNKRSYCKRRIYSEDQPNDQE